jgi:hypothetical protein
MLSTMSGLMDGIGGLLSSAEKLLEPKIAVTISAIAATLIG